MPGMRGNNGEVIYYDSKRVVAPGEYLFDPDYWRRHGQVTPAGTGRGAAWFVNTKDQQQWVLREYRRGGEIAKLIERSYLFTGEKNTRPYREWHVLCELEQRDLPAPRPVAACYRRHGLCYQAAIITERLADTQTLATLLQNRNLGLDAWRAIGACIDRFHRAGVWHADLNAHNILVDASGRVFLIDFDKAKLGASFSTCRNNLKRLLRSLQKLNTQSETFHFNSSDWQTLKAAYDETRTRQ